MAESKELKSSLMKVKEEGEKVGLELSIQKTKIMASGPITSWQIDIANHCSLSFSKGREKSNSFHNHNHLLMGLGPVKRGWFSWFCLAECRKGIAHAKMKQELSLGARAKKS